MVPIVLEVKMHIDVAMGIHSTGISNGCASLLGWGGILYGVLRHRKLNWRPFKMLVCLTAPLSCPTFYKCQLFSFQFNCMWLQRWSSLWHCMWSELDCSRGVNEIGSSIANHLWKLAHNYQQCHQQEHKRRNDRSLYRGLSADFHPATT